MIRITSIGFEGPNRVGKGTQISLLAERLYQLGIPYIVVRGDGSRPNKGKHPGDPWSPWWAGMNFLLRRKGGNPNHWRRASIKLVQELIKARDNKLPRLVWESKSDVGVLLVDRSIISRTVFEMEFSSRNDKNLELYPSHNIDICKIAPDVIFNIMAPKDVLLARISKEDPKSEFRRDLIERKHVWFQLAPAYLPTSVQTRIVEINGDRTPQAIQEVIWRYVKRLVRC